MKKNDFDNRLQNDLFPEMPRSFERKLTEALQAEGVEQKKRPTATGVFTAAVSLVAAAAVLLIVLMGVMSGGRSDGTKAAARMETTREPQTAQPTPGPGEWKGDTKIIALSSGFEFENGEKFRALYGGILDFLMDRGESQPDELWLCAIKNRFVAADTGDRADGYLSGYYVLAQHAFGADDGPELYCLSADFEVLWCTEGSSPGPNHAVNPEENVYVQKYQGHFLYGTAPAYAHVTRGALVGTNPKEKTDIEFSMATSLTQVQERLEGSAHLNLAREYFLMTVPASSWDSVMENPILRFETLEGPVDVNMETELPLENVVLASQPDPDIDLVQEAQQGVEYWLSQNQPPVLDLTDDWYGPEPVAQYAEAIRRALLVSGERVSSGGLWICGVLPDGEHEDGTPPDGAYVMALNAGDGDPSPELFYYRDGRIQWRTAGADNERVNVVHHNGFTIAFGRSPAYDNGPLPMAYGKIVLADGGSDQVAPVLPLDEVQARVGNSPYFDLARECYLWWSFGEAEVRTLTVEVETAGNQYRAFPLEEVNTVEPQTVPAMAVGSGGWVYPGVVTVLMDSLDENGVAAQGESLQVTLQAGILSKGKKVWTRPLEVLTAGDGVGVEGVDVFSADGAALLYGDADIAILDTLPSGEYILCFRTNVQGPYSEITGRYAYANDYTIYQVTLE